MTDDTVIERIEVVLHLPAIGKRIAGSAIAAWIGLEPDDVELVGCESAPPGRKMALSFVLSSAVEV